MEPWCTWGELLEDEEEEVVEEVVVEIEAAVLEDVDLHAGQDAERRKGLVERPDLVELLEQSFAVQAVGDRQTGEWSVMTT